MKIAHHHSVIPTLPRFVWGRECNLCNESGLDIEVCAHDTCLIFASLCFDVVQLCL